MVKRLHTINDETPKTHHEPTYLSFIALHGRSSTTKVVEFTRYPQQFPRADELVETVLSAGFGGEYKQWMMAIICILQPEAFDLSLSTVMLWIVYHPWANANSNFAGNCLMPLYNSSARSPTSIDLRSLGGQRGGSNTKNGRKVIV